MAARKIVLIFALGLLGIAALRDLARLGDALPWHRLYDFADFYCAGDALDRGADPYRYEPLHRCEHAVNSSAAYRADPSRAVPAPLPPYDFPPLMALARLPFPVARAVGGGAIVLAVAATTLAVAALGIPLELAVAALILPAGFLLLDAGQIVPFALLALALCGLALARGRDALAGILSALTLIEPHLGLPVFAAMLVLVPRSRTGALGTALILAIVAELVAGTSTLVEYVVRVLPAQAAAETSYVYQYSLTYLLSWLRVPPAAALVAGQLTYFAMIAVGVRLGAKLSETLRRRELLAYLPAACSVVAGSYVHMVDLAVAIPAALVLAVALRGRPQQVAAVALSLLAVPWIAAWINKKLFLAALFVVAAVFVRLEIAPGPAIGSLAAIAATLYLFELHPPPAFPVASGVSSFAADDLAQDAWRAYVAAVGTGPIGWLLIKIPTWLALGAVLAVAQRVTALDARPRE